MLRRKGGFVGGPDSKEMEIQDPTTDVMTMLKRSSAQVIDMSFSFLVNACRG